MSIACSRKHGKVVGMIAALCKLVHAKNAFVVTVECSNTAVVVQRWGPLLRSLGCVVEADGRIAYDGCALAEASYVLKTSTDKETLTRDQWAALCAQDDPVWARVPFEFEFGGETRTHSAHVCVVQVSA